MYESVSDDYISQEYSLCRLEVLNYDLKQCLKEKENELLKMKESKDAIDSDESSQDDDSLTEEECNLLDELREKNQRDLEEILSSSEDESDSESDVLGW